MKKNKSVLKRTRQAQKAAENNQHYISMMKTSIKKVKSAKSKAEAEPLFKDAVSTIDKVATKGIIHKNNAAHKKSALNEHISKLT
ncbi:MAG: 30S ribosomal protein S20 [Candidatus Marinimicrobia bacterium]|jgi:small subunit ribosomal protein S20|nr:30S ribosomal protein S20 [Candidatus Neomarinimicrobiota bacterium]MCK9483182.1 30S ribosomal protein S20 [Candidatus Neomarinimicrobiota bacterium]MCK9558984.1 30S ribosomal protein S20 [Candidatus Neomarinimicrobiota bacterium]MDD5061579.1 30S ribosomal protein S20 [Candidatus Neomarinimicrobiota bacterium]MDD5231171.1 30S ribosomal protein S20 [Candidatus Neomarinimicrobiota bacterium]